MCSNDSKCIEHSTSIIISCAHANISWCCRSWLSHNLAFYSCHAALGFPVLSCHRWVNLLEIHRMVRRWYLNSQCFESTCTWRSKSDFLLLLGFLAHGLPFKKSSNSSLLLFILAVHPGMPWRNSWAPRVCHGTMQRAGGRWLSDQRCLVRWIGPAQLGGGFK